MKPCLFSTCLGGGGGETKKIDEEKKKKKTLPIFKTFRFLKIYFIFITKEVMIVVMRVVLLLIDALTWLWLFLCFYINAWSQLTSVDDYYYYLSLTFCF